jgi:hypothetical protein
LFVFFFTHDAGYIYWWQLMMVCVCFVQDAVSGRMVVVKVFHTHYRVIGRQEGRILQRIMAADPEGRSRAVRLLVSRSVAKFFMTRANLASRRIFTCQVRKQLAQNIQMVSERLASWLVILLAKSEFYSHLVSW